MQHGSEGAAHDKLSELSTRMKELSDKSTLILIFLSFGLTVCAAVGSYSSLVPAQARALALAMHWWMCAVYPVILGIVPLKEIRWNNPTWYAIVHWVKFSLVWVACIFVFIGARHFIHAL
jgi:hypothetical protein